MQGLGVVRVPEELEAGAAEAQARVRLQEV
jgi:hypothetical protein